MIPLLLKARTSFVLLATLLLCALPVASRAEDYPASRTLKPIPADLKARLPRGSRDASVAEVKLTRTAKPALLLFYGERLDIYERAVTRRGGRNVSRLKLVGRHRLPWSGHAGMEVRLLEPAKGRGPMLFSGEDILTFPRGWAGKVYAISLDPPSASSISARYWNFSSVDKRGFRTLDEMYSEPAMDAQGNTISHSEIMNRYYWTGTEWNKKEPKR